MAATVAKPREAAVLCTRSLECPQTRFDLAGPAASKMGNAVAIAFGLGPAAHAGPHASRGDRDMQMTRLQRVRCGRRSHRAALTPHRRGWAGTLSREAARRNAYTSAQRRVSTGISPRGSSAAGSMSSQGEGSLTISLYAGAGDRNGKRQPRGASNCVTYPTLIEPKS